MGHAAGQFGEGLHRTERYRQTEDVQVVKHVRRIDARHDLEAQHRAAALESVRGELVLMAGQPRIVHGLDQRMQQQVAGNGTRVLLLPVHTQRERLDATAYRIAFVRGEHATETVLREVDLLAEIIVLHHDQTRVHLGMAREVLGGGVDDDIRALVERLL